MTSSEHTEQISRTKKKKAALALQKLGERLVSLSTAQLAGLNLSSELHQAVCDAHTMKSHGARRRQMQYIGSLMREIDAAPIQEALESIGRQDDQAARTFKRVERWRDELVADDDARLEWLKEHFPESDGEQLTRLVQQARGMDTGNQSKKVRRQLYRYLQNLEASQKTGNGS